MILLPLARPCDEASQNSQAGREKDLNFKGTAAQPYFRGMSFDNVLVLTLGLTAGECCSSVADSRTDIYIYNV